MNPERLQRMDDIAEARAEYLNILRELGVEIRDANEEPKPKEVE